MLWILGIIILVVIIAGFSKKFKSRKSSKLNENETETQRVYRLVEEKKAKAKELRLPEIIIDLYFYQIINYPTWLNSDDRKDLVPSEVKFAEEIKNDPQVKQIKVGLLQNVYILEFKNRSVTMPNGSSETHGSLELQLKDKKILAIDMICEYNQLGSIWTPYDLQTFIDGAWVNDFQGLKKHTIELGKKREEKERNRPQNIKNLKDNFNIN
jgi:hypothetical protein